MLKAIFGGQTCDGNKYDTNKAAEHIANKSRDNSNDKKK